MPRKPLLLAAIVFVIVLASVPAQDAITQLSIDLETVFNELGKDVVPNLQTASVLNHGLGSAELGNFPHMYFSFSAGGTVAPGVLEFTKDEEKFENYDLFNNLLDEAGANDEEVRDITDNYAPYPSVRAGFGVGLAGGYELSVQAGIIPQAVTDLAGEEALTGTITTVGTRLRKVLVRRDRGVPAISAGVGYVYSNIDFGYDLAEIDPLYLDGEEGANDYTALELAGTPTFKAMTHSFGFDVRASTRFLYVFYPFVGMSTYYQRSTYEAGVDEFSGVLETRSGGGIPTRTDVEPAVQPYSEQEYDSFNVVLNTGFDMKLLIFNLFAHLNYAVTTQAPGAIVGIRLHF